MGVDMDGAEETVTLRVTMKGDVECLAEALEDVARMLREGYVQGIDRPRGCYWNIVKEE